MSCGTYRQTYTILTLKARLTRPSPGRLPLGLVAGSQGITGALKPVVPIPPVDLTCCEHVRFLLSNHVLRVQSEEKSMEEVGMSWRGNRARTISRDMGERSVALASVER